MIRSLFIAKSGLEAQQTNLDVITNNLANVNTVGYKSQRINFQELFQQAQQDGVYLPSTELLTGTDRPRCRCSRSRCTGSPAERSRRVVATDFSI